MIQTENIITAKYTEWTKGKNPLEARIAVFENIRNITYAIIPKLRDPASGPAGMLELGKGACQPKHYLLADMFTRLGIPVKYMTYSFMWGSQEIKYPTDLKSIIIELPSAYHLACKACINNKWVLVDATWDLPLKKAGFPVNEKWDGSSDTLNGVISFEEVTHQTAEERARFESERRSLYTEKQRKMYAEFIDKFNAWLETLRK